MNNYKLLITAFALIVATGSCQNKSAETSENQTMQHGDSSVSMDSDSTHAMENSDMMKVMSGMMDNMHQMQMTGNVDVDFAMMMKGHHQGAVDMAQVELKSGADEKLKLMAQKIIDDQKAEIAELEKFVESHKNAAKNYDSMKKTEGFGKVMDKNMTMMMDIPKPTAESIDTQFVQMMIPHHQSAVYMAEGFIQSGKDPMLISMAKKMIGAQNKEIEEFKKWNK